jgi:hypothetical protein
MPASASRHATAAPEAPAPTIKTSTRSTITRDSLS